MPSRNATRRGTVPTAGSCIDVTICDQAHHHPGHKSDGQQRQAQPERRHQSLPDDIDYLLLRHSATPRFNKSSSPASRSPDSSRPPGRTEEP